ncbi:MAG: hypothetical protein KF735_04690 [Chelatococcus sp.]|jgi:hypothetical protein|uniref:hypothetical protein n=1 Tax=unclassified Chelatococcus TaxID=2638111 RepID=UPI001BCEA6FA|nr:MULTISPECIES: hypothetical protein [unclassified Chelatococcus]CAH1662528.1 conserved hypothetical protein [Hyphomicrobiales bacterium]MBS7741390.1 hypothetical protein [Chelatococcus sp. HY11]MBX3536908.1 hypothetical protein [Chelatococcus sp.]MBX3546128.1 hypothetical protein [Chelatococcus sp.]MCO5077223.1 hypothetical protein [Chelatococcus sp.]
MTNQEDVLPSTTEPIPTHPEEMKGVFNLRVGNCISMQGSGRITPAGIVTIGLTLTAFAAAMLAVGRLKR